jgi:hypothetical protein
MTILCKNCGLPKPDSEFRGRRKCRACELTYYRAYRRANAEAVAETKRKWAAQNPEVLRQASQEYRDKMWRLAIGLPE